jgi:hypothetical protein
MREKFPGANPFATNRKDGAPKNSRSNPAVARRSRDSDHVFQVRVGAMATLATAARRVKAWAGTFFGASSRPCLLRRGTPRSKKPSLHGKSLPCEIYGRKLPVSDLLPQKRLSSSTSKGSKPAFCVTQRAPQTRPRLLAVHAGLKSVYLHPVRLSQRAQRLSPSRNSCRSPLGVSSRILPLRLRFCGSRSANVWSSQGPFSLPSRASGG